MRQTIAVLVPPEASLFEVATPVGVWGAGREGRAEGRAAGSQDDSSVQSPFRLLVASPEPGQATQSTGGILLGGLQPLDAVRDADLVIVPTWPAVEGPGCAQILQCLRDAGERGAIVVGLCLGAFAVAEAGLLDGREAVTHWAHRERFSARFPSVSYKGDALYVDHGDVVTSAGSAAALDCCLHLVRQSHGAKVATKIARSMVTPPHRQGSQTQFVPPEPALSRGQDGEPEPGMDRTLAATLEHAMQNLGSIQTVSDLASQVGMSRRSLERAFAVELGVSPARWLNSQRLLKARLLLETTVLSVDVVAARSGLGSAPSLRRHFRSELSTTPTAYRNAFHVPESERVR